MQEHSNDTEHKSHYSILKIYLKKDRRRKIVSQGTRQINLCTQRPHVRDPSYIMQNSPLSNAEICHGSLMDLPYFY